MPLGQVGGDETPIVGVSAPLIISLEGSVKQVRDKIRDSANVR